MKKISRRIQNMDMSKKICLIFTAILLLSIAFTYAVMFQSYANGIETTTESLMEQVAETTAVSLDDTFEIAKMITIAPLFSEDLQNMFRAGGNMLKKQRDSRFFLTFLDSMPLSNHAAAFFAQDGSIIFSRLPNLCYNLFEDNYLAWKEISQPYGGTAIVIATDDGSGYSCAVLRSVIDTEFFEDIGLAAVCISTSDFDRAFERIQSISGGRAVVLDSLKHVIYDSASLLQNHSVTDDPVIAILAEQSGRYNVTVASERYTGVNVSQRSGQYRIIIYSPHNKLMAKLRTTQRKIIYIVIGVCFAAFLMILFMSRKLTVPLKKITSLMTCVQEGDFSVRFKSKTQDEIGVLGDNFNLLLERLNQQIQDIVVISNRKKQMEIDILKSQINPHFMYNTLETIHMMAIEVDATEIEEISKVFGRIMRYNITSINETTTLRQELAYLQDYLYIQNVRFHNRFRLIFNVDPTLMDCSIIKMLLQPVVENAILHGFEPTKQAGLIQICATREEDGQRITVSDNGMGIDAESLPRIQMELESGDFTCEKDRIGLKNVNSRIKLYYGEKYGLAIASTAGQGTTIEIFIPVTEGKNEQNRIGG